MKECFPLFDELCESLFSTGCGLIGTVFMKNPGCVADKV
jgi:hypothetical protein